jgi:HEAT repeat protein/DNA-binding NarL/FixJ family response regulator
VRSWHDRRITAGTDWQHQIDKSLESARLILLLISPAFMRSDYCTGIEMKRALRRHADGTARAIPVLLRPVDWENSPFSKLQALPRNTRPVTLWRNRDAAFLDVVHGIRAAIDAMTRDSRPSYGSASVEEARPTDDSRVRDGGKTILEVEIKPLDCTETVELLEQRVLRIIREAVHGVEVIGVRRGSIILTLRLANGEAERLREPIQNGILNEVSLDSHVHTDTLQITNNYIPLLWDEDRAVRVSAAKALGAIGADAHEAVPGLADALSDADPTVRSAAARALGQIGSSEAVPLLGLLLRDTDTSARGCAAEALGRIGSSEAVPLLGRLLRDTDTSVRGRAAEALGRIGSPEALPLLGRLLRESETAVRGRTAEALGRIGSPEALPLLARLLGDKRASVRGSAAEALGRIGSPEAALLLGRLLKDNNLAVRAGTAEALGQISSGDSARLLARLLKDKHPVVRGRAVEALGRSGSPDVAPLLGGLLADKDPAVRGRAVKALGRFGSPGTVSLVGGLLKDDDLSVRRCAMEALERIGSPEANRVLGRATGDEDPSPRGSSWRDPANVPVRTHRSRPSTVNPARLLESTILIVTTDKQFVHFLQRQLRDESLVGFSVIVAGGIDEACSLLGDVNPKLVLVHFGQESVPHEEMNRLLWAATVLARSVSVLVVAERYRVDQATTLYRMGVSEYVSRTHHDTELGRILRAHLRAPQAQAIRDESSAHEEPPLARGRTSESEAPSFEAKVS